MIRGLSSAVALASGLLFGGAGLQATMAAELTLRCGHPEPQESTLEFLWQEFRRLVEERTNGRIEVKVYGGAQLGDSAQLVENMKIGTVDCAGSGSGNIGGHVPKAALLSFPYLIESKAHRDRLVDEDGPFFQAMEKVFEETGDYRLMGMFTSGVRSVYNSKRPIQTPEDLKGMKLRTMTSEAQVRSWEALGAVPTAMPFAEVYAALQSGVVDGAENSPMFLWNMKHFEAATYYSMTSHLINTGYTLISEQAYQRIPEDLRAIVMQAGAEASAAERQYDDEVETTYLERLQEAGTQINEVDTTPFVALAQPLHDQMAEGIGAADLLEIVRAEAKATGAEE